MPDVFPWTINLGRWRGVWIRVHLVLVLFVVGKLLGATPLFDPKSEVDALATLGWLSLLLVALAAHELGHYLMALRLDVEPDDIRLWPLGNFQGPAPIPLSRASETFLVALAGPLVNAALATICAVGLWASGARMVLNPFGHEGSGAPLLAAGGVATAFTPIWWAGWFGFINWVLFLANMIPALPMDGGRMLRAALAGPALLSNRDGLIAPWTARAFAIILAIAGIWRLFSTIPDGGVTLLLLAALIELMVRAEARMFDEDLFDEGLFGYDFSEGYTSLESSGPKVRPTRESLLSRWRRRRSEQRKLRLDAKQAADELRMDEILAKLHALGRESLTAEEQRFLVRVSNSLRKRTRE